MALATVTGYLHIRERRRHAAKMIAADFPNINYRDWEITSERGDRVEFTCKNARERLIVNVATKRAYIALTYYGCKLQALRNSGQDITLYDDGTCITVIQWDADQATVSAFLKRDGSDIKTKPVRPVYNAILKGNYILLNRKRIYRKEAE